MIQLHETVMGKRLIENTLPEIAKQLKRLGDILEEKNIKEATLKEKYRTLSSLDPDPKSKHPMNVQILKEMDKVLKEIKELQ